MNRDFEDDDILHMPSLHPKEKDLNAAKGQQSKVDPNDSHKVTSETAKMLPKSLDEKAQDILEKQNRVGLRVVYQEKEKCAPQTFIFLPSLTLGCYLQDESDKAVVDSEHVKSASGYLGRGVFAIFAHCRGRLLLRWKAPSHPRRQ